MPIYVYRCDGCGLRFERLISRDAEAPACPECGRTPRKVPAAVSLSSPAPAAPKDTIAPPWRVLAGDPERQRREVEFRQRLAATPASDSPSGNTGDSAAASSGGEAGVPPASG